MRIRTMSNDTYSGQERRTQETHVVLTDKQIEDIAKKAAAEAVSQLTDHVYRQVGKGVVTKLFYIVGALTVGLYMLARSKGIV